MEFCSCKILWTQSISQSVHHTNQTNRPNTKLQEQQPPNSFLSFTVSNHTMSNWSSPKTCIPFIFPFCGCFCFAILIPRKSQLLRDWRFWAFKSLPWVHPPHPTHFSLFHKRKTHQKQKKIELKFTCRELKFPMESNIEFPNTRGLVQKVPHLVMSWKFIVGRSSFPTYLMDSNPKKAPNLVIHAIPNLPLV